MPRDFDDRCREAIELAKSALPPDAHLDVRTLMAALAATTGLGARFPAVAQALPAPAAKRSRPGKMPLDPELKRLLNELLEDPGPPVTPEAVLVHLADSEMGRAVLGAVPGAHAHNLVAALRDAAEPWRESGARRAAVAALEPFGRLLTDASLPRRPFRGREDELGALVRALCKTKRRSALVLGEAGTGKTALVLELARRIVHGDAELPARVRELDIFELSPVRLKSGASLVGEYATRLQAVVDVLRRHPRIVLFVDEIHSFLQSSMHFRGPFTESNEALKASLGHGEIACIGCTTMSEYRHYIEPDAALVRRFKVIRLAAPTREATLDILGRRAHDFAAHFEVRIDPPMLDRAFELSERHLPERAQPDKSIQLLEDACAFACTQKPPRTAVDDEALLMAIEDVIGHSLVKEGQLTEESVAGRLRERFVGQDEVLAHISRAFVAGLSTLVPRKGPRGVFLFAGPTGTGKTEVAVELSRLLGDPPAFIQVSCNTLAGGVDGGPAQAILIGAAPGYIGYSRGQGGLLSKIRDKPEAVVLFDELDKAPPKVYELLLQILDKGAVEDVEGRMLDFSRAFIVFTTNRGWQNAGRRPVGFGERRDEGVAEAARLGLEQAGAPPEFVARIRHVFVFHALSTASVAAVLGRRLRLLGERVRGQGLALEWHQDLIPHLMESWQPRLGARHLNQIIENRVVEQIGIADTQGELEGVQTIRLEVLQSGADRREGGVVVEREQRESVLVLKFA